MDNATIHADRADLLADGRADLVFDKARYLLDVLRWPTMSADFVKNHYGLLSDSLETLYACFQTILDSPSLPWRTKRAFFKECELLALGTWFPHISARPCAHPPLGVNALYHGRYRIRWEPLYFAEGLAWERRNLYPKTFAEGILDKISDFAIEAHRGSRRAFASRCRKKKEDQLVGYLRCGIDVIWSTLDDLAHHLAILRWLRCLHEHLICIWCLAAPFVLLGLGPSPPLAPFLTLRPPNIAYAIWRL